MKTVLVTGASGFVGRALRNRLVVRGYAVRGAFRTLCGENSRGSEATIVGTIDEQTDWGTALRGCKVVLHLAARVHVTDDSAADPWREFRRVNVDGTLNLGRQAAEAGVKRLVFLSSIKVNGDNTEVGCAFAADQLPEPMDPYGVSKMEAENGLWALAKETGIEVVIVRPPLVYGPGVKANFLAMMRWLSRGIPLPLGAVTENRRSLVALDNLVDLIVTCIDHPAAANQTFLVSDGEDLSTAELLRRMGQALGTPARLIPVPVGLLKLGATLLGRPGLAQRLCGSLQVDITKTRELLGWSPPVSVDEGLRRTALHWLDTQGRSRG